MKRNDPPRDGRPDPVPGTTSDSTPASSSDTQTRRRLTLRDPASHGQSAPPRPAPPSPARPPTPDRESEVIASATLLKGRDAVLIEHNGRVYELRKTRQGKLILTK